MAINAISGRPGSGKTYEAVIRHILPALQDKRMVITNIPLNVEWFCNFVGPHCKDLIVLIHGGFHEYGGKRYFSEAEHFLRYQDWRNDKNQGVFFVVDECHLAMPRTSAADGTTTSLALREYLSMHRHYGHDVLLLSQNFRKVNRDIVDMVQTCYFTIKLSFLGKDDEYVCKAADGVTRNIVTTHRRAYEKKYFGAYHSHTKSQGSVQEARTVDIPPWHKRWYNIGAVFMGIIFLALVTAMLSRNKADQNEQSNRSSQSVEQQQVVSAQPKTAQPIQSAQSKPIAKPEQNEPAKHPYFGLQLHIVGKYEDMNQYGKFQKIIWLSVSRNGQVLSEINHGDLALAGYQFTVLNDCMMDLRYGDKYQQYVFCDTPTQRMVPPEVASALTEEEKPAG